MKNFPFYVFAKAFLGDVSIIFTLGNDPFNFS